VPLQISDVPKRLLCFLKKILSFFDNTPIFSKLKPTASQIATVEIFDISEVQHWQVGFVHCDTRTALSFESLFSDNNPFVSKSKTSMLFNLRDSFAEECASYRVAQMSTTEDALNCRSISAKELLIPNRNKHAF